MITLEKILRYTGMAVPNDWLLHYFLKLIVIHFGAILLSSLVRKRQCLEIILLFIACGVPRRAAASYLFLGRLAGTLK
jgi:hypothetical protein